MTDILVVDDDKDACNALRLRLAQCAPRIIAAYSGDEAIEAFERHKPDVVLLDGAMPGTSGADVCAYIRARDPNRRIKVVFVSGASAPTESYVRRCAALAGANAFVRKPYDGDELVHLVRYMVHCAQETPP